MLSQDPRHRPTASEILNSKWLKRRPHLPSSKIVFDHSERLKVCFFSLLIIYLVPEDRTWLCEVNCRHKNGVRRIPSPRGKSVPLGDSFCTHWKWSFLKENSPPENYHYPPRRKSPKTASPPTPKILLMCKIEQPKGKLNK